MRRYPRVGGDHCALTIHEDTLPRFNAKTLRGQNITSCSEYEHMSLTRKYYSNFSRTNQHLFEN